jgi:hypothetical protein
MFPRAVVLRNANDFLPFNIPSKNKKIPSWSQAKHIEFFISKKKRNHVIKNLHTFYNSIKIILGVAGLFNFFQNSLEIDGKFS